MRINQNTMANNAYRNLSSTNVSLGKSLEKLSSGFRINRAADDAAGLVISQGLRAQVGGLRQATRNAQDGISVVQTAEGALNEVHNMLGRMRDLSVQAANVGANDTASRTAAQSEFNELSAEITRISESTAFGGVKLLDGGYGEKPAKITGFDADGLFTTSVSSTFNLSIDKDGVGAAAAFTTLEVTMPAVALSGASGADTAAALQSAIRAKMMTTAGGTAAVDVSAFANKVTVTSEPTGVGTGQALTINIGGLEKGGSFQLIAGTTAPTTALAELGFAPATSTASSGAGGNFQIGANEADTLKVSIAGVSLGTLGLTGLTTALETAAAATITKLDTAIATVSTQRGQLGAKQNRFESMINNLQVTTENLVASESRIRDTDMAAEMTNFTKNQILSQAGTAMLAQANQVPQSILSLLR